jgi:chromosome segregation ATPase
MWGELEKLHNAALEAKAALPTFLETQKGNMSLYHTSMVNEAYQDSQEELNAQHKKVNLQHNLILEHQQAFQDYKANVEPQLEEAKELQERVSRLTLEKGAVKEERGEMEAKWKATEAEKEESTKKIEEVQEELDAAVRDTNSHGRVLRCVEMRNISQAVLSIKLLWIG